MHTWLQDTDVPLPRVGETITFGYVGTTKYHYRVDRVTHVLGHAVWQENHQAWIVMGTHEVRLHVTPLNDDGTEKIEEGD